MIEDTSNAYKQPQKSDSNIEKDKITTKSKEMDGEEEIESPLSM